jgi:hypothetical protein
MPGSIEAQLTRDTVQACRSGTASVGSSSDPALMNTVSGWSGGCVYIGDPQSGQKNRVTGRPLSADFVKALGVPATILNLLAAARTLTPNALPLIRRQSSQWQ